MSEETSTPEVAPDAAPEAAEKPKRGGNRKPRKPKLKDWIRVIKSQGNGLENVTMHLIINEATGLCELVTNAPKKEGEEGMEGERTQVFKVTGIEVLNDPNRDPLAAQEEAETEPTAEAQAEAPAEG